MASPGELVQVVARCLGVPEAVVVQHDRNLVVAGKRSKGGRGRSAAKVTPEDAANLLIAVAASTYVKDTLATLETYSSLQAKSNKTGIKLPMGHDMSSDYGAAWRLVELPVPALCDLPRGHTFIDALVALISSMVDKSFEKAGQYLYDQPPMERGGTEHKGLLGDVEFTSPYERAAINIRSHRFSETVLYASKLSFKERYGENQRSNANPHWPWSDLKQRKEFSFNTLFVVSDCIRN